MLRSLWPFQQIYYYTPVYTTILLSILLYSCLYYCLYYYTPVYTTILLSILLYSCLYYYTPVYTTVYTTFVTMYVVQQKLRNILPFFIGMQSPCELINYRVNSIYDRIYVWKQITLGLFLRIKDCGYNQTFCSKESRSTV